MYSLVFGTPDNFQVIASSDDLHVLKINRVVSGDIVINPDMTVCQSDEWLWDWEKIEPLCYARRAQDHGWQS